MCEKLQHQLYDCSPSFMSTKNLWSGRGLCHMSLADNIPQITAFQDDHSVADVLKFMFPLKKKNRSSMVTVEAWSLLGYNIKTFHSMLKNSLHRILDLCIIFLIIIMIFCLSTKPITLSGPPYSVITNYKDNSFCC